MGPSGSISCSAAQPVKRSHLSSYMPLVEDLLDAAASLDTSSENPAARQPPCVQTARLPI